MPFILSILAGLSTLIGYMFIKLKNKENRVLIISLGFASGVMFYISLFDLIPEGIFLLKANYILCIISISIGLFIALLLDIIFPNNTSSLYHVGIVSMIAIIIHNIPEGIATYLTASTNIKLGITLAIAIALHNIPEGITISIPIYYSTKSKVKAFIYTFTSGISELLGAVIASIFLTDLNSKSFMGILYSIIAGIMLYISLHELLPESLKYKKSRLTYISFILGIIIIYISIKIIN